MHAKPLKNHSLIVLGIVLAQLILSACKESLPSTKIAEIDGQVVTTTDLEKSGGRELFRQRQELYHLEQKKLDEYIAAVLLTKEAKRRGVSVATLLDQEVNSKILPVRDDDLTAFYQSNKDRLRVEFEKVREQIRQYIYDQRVENQKANFVNSLRAKAKIVTYLKPPPVFRVDIALDGAPFRGSEKATVTIIKFEDFECPYCKAAQPTFADLLKRYDGKVRVVHKDLPLDAIHPRARQAAEAARCAGEQGEFWQYHDKLYSSLPKLDVGDLKNYAIDIGLKGEAFEKCLASGKFRDAVQRDLSQGAELGLTGTPAFFINGREITGAQPFEVFAAIIDDELARSK